MYFTPRSYSLWWKYLRKVWCKNYLTVFQDTCKLTLQPLLTAGLYGVAIQIEDFASRLDRTPLSSVALQFIINVYLSDSNCTSSPRFSYLTRSDKSCIGVEFNKTYNEILFATTGTTDEMWVSCIRILIYHL